MAPWRAIQDAHNVYPRRHNARVGQSSFLASAPRQASFHHSFFSFDHLGRSRKKELPLSCPSSEFSKRANFYVSRHPCSDSALFGTFVSLGSAPFSCSVQLCFTARIPTNAGHSPRNCLRALFHCYYFVIHTTHLFSQVFFRLKLLVT